VWKKYLIIVILFYFFALLQNSFLAHFNILGTAPNLVFIFFCILVFFENYPKNTPNFYRTIFFAITAGLFLDISSHSYLGICVVVLLIIGFSFKKIQVLLRNMEDNYPLIYFLSLFSVFFITYQFLLSVIGFDFRFLVELIYNLAIATIGFSVFKRLLNVQKVQN